jgi:site-specific recombinase XerD
MINMGKCGKSRRVPLTKHFWLSAEEYMSWRRTRPGDMLMAYPDPKPGQTGQYTACGMAHAIRNHWKSIERHISPHTFRRSFGRHLYKAGMPIVEIQKLYGHARPEVTVSYLGIQDEDLASSLMKYQPRY